MKSRLVMGRTVLKLSYQYELNKIQSSREGFSLPESVIYFKNVDRKNA
jgi:hypothetical protein